MLQAFWLFMVHSKNMHIYIYIYIMFSTGSYYLIITDKMAERKQFICVAIVHLLVSLGIFSLGLYFGNGNAVPKSKCPPEQIHSPYNLLSNITMTAFLLKVPIYAKQLHQIIIYEENVVIGCVPGANVCDLRARIIDCSPSCFDNDVCILTNGETEELSRLLHGMIQCDPVWSIALQLQQETIDYIDCFIECQN